MNNKKLEEFENYIKQKKVAIIGIGVSNIPLLDYFKRLNAYVTVFDEREENEISPIAMEKIKKYGFNYIFMKNCLDKLEGFDIILRSPSCMPDKPQIVKEVEKGAILTSEIELLLKLVPCKVIGITGTEGKTTTSNLIYEIIKKSGKRCFLGGNMGKPLFTQISSINSDDIVVVELSSFQLMDIDVSPHISIVTNIYPDHLNVHKTYQEYRQAKTNIFKYQNEDDIVVLNYDNEYTKEFAKPDSSKNICKIILE